MSFDPREQLAEDQNQQPTPPPKPNEKKWNPEEEEEAKKNADERDIEPYEDLAEDQGGMS